MPKVILDAATQGDILEEDVVVNQVVLFEAGTFLTPQRLDILKSLKVRSLTIADRSEKRAVSLDTVFMNLDKRFSYVDGVPYMMDLTAILKDILANTEVES